MLRIVRNWVPLVTQSTMDLSKLRTLSDSLEKARKSAQLLHSHVSNILSDITDAEKQLRLLVADHKSAGVRNYQGMSSIDEEPPTKRIKGEFSIEDGYVVAYTDGACQNNGKSYAKAGIGVWFDYNHPLNVSKPVQGRPTNNTAEIQACIQAIQIAKDNDINKLKIKTDSQFVINSMTKWITNWKKRGWKTVSGEVKNKEDFQKLDSLCSEMTDVKWEYVRGHADSEGNIQADSLATKGAEFYEKSI